MEKKINEQFNISKIKTQKEEIKRKKIKICINVPKQYYYAVEQMKLDTKITGTKYFPAELIVEQLLVMAFYNKKTNDNEITFKKMKIFCDKYYKEHAEQSLSTRIPMKLYIEMQKAKLDGQMLGYHYSINCMVNFVIFYYLINENTKITAQKFVSELCSTQIQDAPVGNFK